MMGFMALLLVAGGATFACVWTLRYVPIIKKVPFKNKYYSPRMFIINRLLEPMDAGITLILVAGSWIGITSALGISAMVYNVLSGIGLSVGVLVVKKFMAPRWEKQYENKLLEFNTSNNKTLI
jgi:hypothetical protein